MIEHSRSETTYRFTLRLLCALFVLCVSGHLHAQTDKPLPTRFRFVLTTPAKAVYLAGTFNQWQATALPMQSTDGGTTWTITLPLTPGSHQYKFVVNGTEWRTDPMAKEISDGNGNTNSVVLVGLDGFEIPARRGDGSITRSALRHRPNSISDCNADRTRGYLTFRARKDDLESVAVVFREKGRTAQVPMEMLAQDDLFAYYRLAFSLRDCEYVFLARDGASSVWVSPAGLSEQPPTASFHFDKRVGSRLLVPEWVQDAVFYQIMPDRFANGDPKNDPKSDASLDETGRKDTFFGGDFQGVTAHLDYLRELGINALYFTPIFTSLTHHKYDTDDYEHVDTHFGGDAAFLQMAKAAKARQMRLVLDGVFNHIGIHFFAFRDLLAKQEKSAYKDWFFVNKFPVKVEPKPNYVGWWGIEYLPKLNQNNSAVRNYLLGVVEHWMKRVPLDGWRLDAANEVDDRLWQELRPRVRALNPNAALIGEIWNDASRWTQGDMFDSVMNYPWRFAVLDWIAARKSKPSEFDQRVQWLMVTYPRQSLYGMYSLLGSHDTSRLRTECGGDWKRVRLAFLLHFAGIGAPAIYYGDEIGMEGGRDPDNRRPMDWNPSPEGRSLLAYVKRLIALRHSQRVLRRGDWKTLLTDDTQNVYAFARYDAQEQALVVLNNGTQAAKVTLTLPLPTSRLKIGLDSETEMPANTFLPVRDNKVEVTLPAMSGKVFLSNDRLSAQRPNPTRSIQ